MRSGRKALAAVALLSLGSPAAVPAQPWLERQVAEAYAHLEAQRLGEAVALLKDACARVEREGGARSLVYADLLVHLSELRLASGEGPTAVEPLLRQSLAIKRDGLGPRHLEVGNALDHLALLKMRQKAYAEAEPLIEEALAIWESTPGAELLIQQARLQLAEVYAQQGRQAEAEALRREARAMKGPGGRGPTVAVPTVTPAPGPATPAPPEAPAAPSSRLPPSVPPAAPTPASMEPSPIRPPQAPTTPATTPPPADLGDL